MGWSATFFRSNKSRPLRRLCRDLVLNVTPITPADVSTVRSGEGKMKSGTGSIGHRKVTAGGDLALVEPACTPTSPNLNHSGEGRG